MAQIIHMNKGIVPRLGIDTEMPDGGVIVIQRDGYLDTDAYDIKYCWLHCCVPLYQLISQQPQYIYI